MPLRGEFSRFERVLGYFCKGWFFNSHYVKPYLGEKGQDLVEYALLLAIVVGIGFLIYQSSGLNENLKTIFNNASQVTSSAASISTSTTTTQGGKQQGQG